MVSSNIESNQKSGPRFLRAAGDIRIRLTNDYMFKALLQKNPKVLKALVCALLHLDPRSVRVIKVSNPIILGEAADDKTVILDVRTELDDGTSIDLEMQVANEKNWIKRSHYYVCKGFAHLEIGQNYDLLRPMLQIGFLDFTLFPESPRFYSTYRMMEQETHRPYGDMLSIGVVDLTKIELANKADRRYNVDTWARLFKAQTWEEIKDIAVKGAEFMEAAETVYELCEDEAIWEQCLAREDYIRRQRAAAEAMEERDALKIELALSKSELAVKDDEIAAKDDELAAAYARIAELEAAGKR